MLDDLMLLHHSLWAEQAHDLATLASLDGCLPKLKHLAAQDLALYNWGDCVETLVVWGVYEREASLDPRALHVYRQQLLKLIPIHTRASERGMSVNKALVWVRMAEEVEKLREAMYIAWAYVGYPLNLSSMGEDGQVGVLVFKVLRYKGKLLPAQRDTKTHKLTVDRDAVGVLRQLVGPAYDPEEEKRKGVTVAYILQRIEEGANPLLEARMLFAQAQQVLSHYIVPLVRI